MYEMGPASSTTSSYGSNSTGISEKAAPSTSRMIASEPSHFQGLPMTLTGAAADFQSFFGHRTRILARLSPKKLVIKRLKMTAVGTALDESIATVFDAKLQPTMSFLQRFPLYHSCRKKWASYEMKYVTDDGANNFFSFLVWFGKHGALKYIYFSLFIDIAGV